MNLRTHAHRRSAASLVELLAAMSAASLVTAAAAGLVHKSFSLESRARSVIAEERTALRLARQFRADIHAGLSASCSPDAAAEADLVRIEGPAGSVVYRQEGTGLVRIEAAVAGVLTRDDFFFPQSVSWAANQNGRLVTLLGSTVAGVTASSSSSPQRPRPAITISAALPPAPAVPLPAGDSQ
jgi:hypothetical protein